MGRASSVSEADFAESARRVLALPPASPERRELWAAEAARFGFKPAGYNSRLRRWRARNTAPAATAEPLPKSPDGSTLFDHARRAAAAGDDQVAPSGDLDDRAPPRELGPNDIGPDFVVQLAVGLIQVTGRLVGLMMGVSGQLAARAIAVTPEEKAAIREAAPLAVPWIQKTLGESSATAGAALFLGTMGVVVWSQVDRLSAVKEYDQKVRRHQANREPETETTETTTSAASPGPGSEGPPPRQEAAA